MSLNSVDDQFSDDEVFLGPLTLKEITKEIFPNTRRQTVGSMNNICPEDNNRSIKIIETHSAPDIVSVGKTITPVIVMTKASSSSKLTSSGVMGDCDLNSKGSDIYVSCEKMIADISLAEYKDSDDDKLKDLAKNNLYETAKCDFSDEKLIKDSETAKLKDCQDPFLFITRNTPNLLYKTPSKYTSGLSKTPIGTPVKDNEIKKSQSTELKLRTPTFKTPGSAVSHKKLTPMKKPLQNVVSPVANYIKKCPVVTLLKNVRPNKPIPGTSCIPKPVKSTPGSNKINKENTNLPHIAYRVAKETKVIHLTDEHKLPQNNWAKQVASSIPKAVVMKHSHREIKSTNKGPRQTQEDSFSNLSMHQADLSICTQKSAFKEPKKP